MNNYANTWTLEGANLVKLNFCYSKKYLMAMLNWPLIWQINIIENKTFTIY